MATKKGLTINFFHPSLLLLFLDPGSEIRDPERVKIRIRDKHPGSATLKETCRLCLTPVRIIAAQLTLVVKEELMVVERRGMF